MEAVNFQFGSNALGAIAEELRDGSASSGQQNAASTDVEGAQNWWAHFADTGQHSPQYPLSIAGIPKAELSKTYSCNLPSSFSCNCSLPDEGVPVSAKAQSHGAAAPDATSSPSSSFPKAEPTPEPKLGAKDGQSEPPATTTSATANGGAESTPATTTAAAGADSTHAASAAPTTIESTPSTTAADAGANSAPATTAAAAPATTAAAAVESTPSNTAAAGTGETAPATTASAGAETKEPQPVATDGTAPLQGRLAV